MKKLNFTAKRGRLFTLLTAFLLSACLILAVPGASAAKEVKVQVTVVMSGHPPTMLPAGDDPNHLVGLARMKGQAVFSDGRKAAYGNVFFLDIFRGRSATMWGYTKMTFEDSSWMFFKWDSAVVGRDEAGNPLGKGKGTLLAGTGPYKGIKGSVQFTNKRLPPNKEHPRGATQAKAAFTYTLP